MMTVSSSKIVAQTQFEPKEIFEIAEEINRKYSPIVSVKSHITINRITLTPKQLLEISDEISRKYTPRLNATTPKLVLLPIDPAHIYASWNLPDLKQSPDVGKSSQEHDIVLRIYPHEDEINHLTNRTKWFDVALNTDRTKQTIMVPSEYRASSYQGAIGRREQNDDLTVITTFKIEHSPRTVGTFIQFENSGSPPSDQFPALSSVREKPLQASSDATSPGAQ